MTTLTRTDRRAMRERLARVNLDWRESSPYFWVGRHSRDGEEWEAAVFRTVDGYEWTLGRYSMAKDVLHILCRREAMSAESAKLDAATRLTDYLLPLRSDALALLDFADKVDEFFRDAIECGLSRPDIEAAYKDLFGEGYQP